jgi:hypothetical protein
MSLINRDESAGQRLSLTHTTPILGEVEIYLTLPALSAASHVEDLTSCGSVARVTVAPRGDITATDPGHAREAQARGSLVRRPASWISSGRGAIRNRCSRGTRRAAPLRVDDLPWQRRDQPWRELRRPRARDAGNALAPSGGAHRLWTVALWRSDDERINHRPKEEVME